MRFQYRLFYQFLKQHFEFVSFFLFFVFPRLTLVFSVAKISLVLVIHSAERTHILSYVSYHYEKCVQKNIYDEGNCYVKFSYNYALMLMSVTLSGKAIERL